MLAGFGHSATVKQSAAGPGWTKGILNSEDLELKLEINKNLRLIITNLMDKSSS
jgi:hypothetical protein